MKKRNRSYIPLTYYMKSTKAKEEKKYHEIEEKIMLEFAKCLNICYKDLGLFSELVYDVKQDDYCKTLYDILKNSEFFPLYMSYVTTVYESIGKKIDKCKD